MNNSRINSRGPSITARLTPAEKALFAELAAARGISESALALIAIRAYWTPMPHSPTRRRRNRHRSQQPTESQSGSAEGIATPSICERPSTPKRLS